jgi:hypothetical protein
MTVVEGQLDDTTLHMLVDGNVDVLIVEDFLTSDICHGIANNLCSEGHDHYRNAPSIGRIGMALYEAESSPNLLTTITIWLARTLNRFGQLASPTLALPTNYDAS